MLARIWSHDYILDVFDDWARDRRGGLWVAVEDGEIVGIAKLTLLCDREAWLHALRVDPRRRRRGIGTALLAHRLERARGLGARVARLDTAEGNVAVHRLMRRFGFRRIGRFTLWMARARAGDAPRRVTRSRRARVSAWSTTRSTRPFRSRLRSTCEVILTSVPANAARAVCEGC